MGESTDSSVSDTGEALSDESIEAQERGQDISKSIGFASDQARDDYLASQADIQNRFMSGEALGANLNNVTANLPDTLDRQDFAREQDFFDANPNFTGINAPFTTRSADLDPQLGAGDIFGLRDSVRKQLSLGGDAVLNDGRIVGVMGNMRDAPVFGALPAFMSNLLPDVKVYTGLSEFDPNRSVFDDGDNTTQNVTPPVVNQMTGKSQCPEGYVFDTQLQACRLKTKTDDQLGTPKDPPEGGGQMFVRNYSLLNQAPMNVPQGFDYNAMNTNFMNRFGTRPSIFKNPPNLLGFTPFGSS